MTEVLEVYDLKDQKRATINETRAPYAVLL